MFLNICRQVNDSMEPNRQRHTAERSDFRFAIALCFPKSAKDGAARASERGTNASTLASRRRRRSRTDPQGFIPANRMPYAGMANASDRADLLAYLLKATK
jgi:hypothetical protein